MPNITMIPVKSSQIESYGYDAETKTLAVRFHGGPRSPASTYHYRNFEQADWDAFQAAESKGSHFIRNIKSDPGRWPYERQPD